MNYTWQSSSLASCWPVVILGAAAAVYFFGYLPRERTTKRLDAAAAVRRITPPLVNAAVVKRAAPSTQLTAAGKHHADHGSIYLRPRRRLFEAALCRYRRSRARRPEAGRYRGARSGSTGIPGAGCAGASPGTARPVSSRAGATHRNARSGGDHLAEIQDPDRRRRGVAAGRR